MLRVNSRVVSSLRLGFRLQRVGDSDRSFSALAESYFNAMKQIKLPKQLALILRNLEDSLGLIAKLTFI